MKQVIGNKLWIGIRRGLLFQFQQQIFAELIGRLGDANLGDFNCPCIFAISPSVDLNFQHTPAIELMFQVVEQPGTVDLKKCTLQYSTQCLQPLVTRNRLLECFQLRRPKLFVNGLVRRVAQIEMGPDCRNHICGRFLFNLKNLIDQRLADFLQQSQIVFIQASDFALGALGGFTRRFEVLRFKCRMRGEFSVGNLTNSIWKR